MGIADKLNQIKQQATDKELAEKKKRDAEHARKAAGGIALADQLWTKLEAQKSVLASMGLSLERKDDFTIRLKHKAYEVIAHCYDAEINLIAGYWDPKWPGSVSLRNSRLDNKSKSADEAETQIATILSQLTG